jgi:hypothetical protein
LGEPTLQGARARDVVGAERGVGAGLLEETQTQEAGSPGGVLLVQCQGDGEEGILAGRSSGTGLIVGRELGWLLAEAAAELADGTGIESESSGDGAGVLAALGALGDLPAQG